jgi:hypothetical protein
MGGVWQRINLLKFKELPCPFEVKLAKYLKYLKIWMGEIYSEVLILEYLCIRTLDSFMCRSGPKCQSVRLSGIKFSLV